MQTKDHIKIGDNIEIRLGDSGATDSKIFFDGTSLKFYDSDLAATKTLKQLFQATAPSLDDAYNNDAGGIRTIVVDAGNVEFELADATNDYNIVIDNTTTGAIADALLVDTSGVGGTFTDGLDVSDAGITNAINVGGNTIKGTTAVIDFTNFDVTGAGNVTIGGNLTVSGTWSVNALAAAAAAGTLSLNGDTTGGVNIGSTSTGAITLGAATDVASGKVFTVTGLEGSNVLDVTAGDMRILDGSLTITDDDNANSLALTNNTITTGTLVGLTSTSLTTGKGISLVADAVTSGSLVYLESSAGGFTGKWIQGYNGTADDFSIGLNGLLTLKGNAAGTDVVVLTAGDLQLTSGNIDVDAGKVEVDTATDQTSYFKRNQGVTTGPVVEIEATAAADDYPCLLCDQNATGAIDGLQVTIAGTGAGAHVTGEAAGSVGLKIDVADSQTGRLIFGDMGPWLGTTDQGALEFISDSAATIPAGNMIRLDQRGSGQHAAAINGTCLFAQDIAAAPGAGTSYAVYINATNIEALKVDAGRAMFDEGLDILDAGTLRIGTGNDISITSNGTNVHLTNTGTFTIGDGGTTNYAEFAANTGKLALVGTARVTKKMFVGAGAFAAHTGSPALTQVGTGLTFGWAMDAAADESIYAHWQIPEDWDSTAAITAKIFWVANAAAGDAIFDLTTLGLVESETVNAAGNADSVTDTTDGTAWDLNITAAMTIAAAELAAGDFLAVKINRDADNAADTLAADALVLGVEFTYTSNKLGS